MKIKTLSLSAVVLLTGLAAGHAQMASEADKAACKPDVNRLCSDYIPDRDRIIACLKKNISSLGHPCLAVMKRAAKQ